MMGFYNFLNTMLTLFPLKLYTTSSCHLCDDAYKILSSLKLNDQLILIDVADDDALLSSYGMRIPVLHRTDNTNELNWPFTEREVIRFLTRN